MGNATVQNAVLAVLADAGRCLVLDELAAALGLTKNNITIGARALIERGYAVRRERGCFEITPEGVALRVSGMELSSGPRGPVKRTRGVKKSLRRCLWRAIRIKQKFTVCDLLVLSTNGDEKSARNNAQGYVRALAAAGYLAELRSLTPNGPKRYALVRDTGPEMPLLRHELGIIYDPNTKAVYPCAPSTATGGDA